MMPNNNLIQRFQQFKQSFTGNPQQQVQQLLNSGKVSQEQYNQAVKMAQQLQQLLK
jgi:vancomycin permeability regulator SanA